MWNQQQQQQQQHQQQQQQQQQPMPAQPQGQGFFAPYEPAPQFATCSNADARGRIDKLVAYVCKNGPQFEQMVGPLVQVRVWAMCFPFPQRGSSRAGAVRHGTV
jgi:hypothetical protein